MLAWVFVALPAYAGGEERLVGLIEARLALQVDVARYKWNTHGAIDDPLREQQIIDGLKLKAATLGVPVPWAERFFRAQIEAGKTLQRMYFVRWKAAQEGRFEGVPDLVTQTRPKLDALTPPLLDALADVWPKIAGGEINVAQWQASWGAQLNPQAVDIALAPLREGVSEPAP